MRARKRIVGLVALWSVAGCEPPELPGELIGKYAIRATLLDNTCGDEALPLASTLHYRVELREDGATAYWLVGAPPANLGVITAAGDVRFQREERFRIRRDAEPIDPELSELDPLVLYGYDPLDPVGQPNDNEAPCTLIVRESIEATVRRDAEEGAEDALLGRNVIEMRPTRDSECRRVLTTAGGPFEALPCAATYELTGELLERAESNEE